MSNWLIGLSTLWLLAACSSPLQAQATIDCQDPAETASTDRPVSPGRSMLGQGIALFDAKDFKQAERALQSALFAGLPDRQERSSAHKYLAFVSCSNSEWLRCETEFDSAFAARPSFALEVYELQNTPWRDAYLRAQNRWAARCGRVALAPGIGAAALPSGAKPATSGFALNSSVIVGITPLPLVPMSGRLGAATPVRAERDVPSDTNVTLRVSPWAVVQVDGKRLGVTPPMTHLSLPAGSRTIELFNPGFETVKRVVQVVNGKTITITHDFDSR
ncbi:MAG: PEGA domain-containing protein [Rhizobacter sp.]